jgi:PAS domain S-box-containing protein
MGKQLKVLLVEDSPDDTLLLLRELKRSGYDPVHKRVDTGIDMEAALTDSEWDVVISDYNMPGFDAPTALHILRQSGLDIPFIIVSGKIGEDLAVAAMKAGAHDYLMKGNLSRLVPAIERELREAAARSQHRKAQASIRKGKMEWEAVFDAVSDLIILTGLDGRIVRCNKKARDYFAGEYEELLEQKIHELFFGVGKEATVFQLQQHATSGHEEDVQFPRLKGWFNVSSYPMYFETEKPTGIVFIIKDITRRKRIEEEKRTIDRELLTLYAVAFRLHSKHGLQKIMGDLLFQLHNMLQIDFSGIHLLEQGSLMLKASLGLSRRFERAVRTLPMASDWGKKVLKGSPFKGTTPGNEFAPRIKGAAKDMGGRSWCAIPLKIGSEVIGSMTVATRSAKSFSDREIFLLTSIGNQLAVLIENYNLYEQMKEKAEELLKSRRELKENLQKVKKANIELERLNLAKNSFIGMASHELKTPITSIMGGVQFLLKYSNLQMTPEQLNIFNSVYEGIIQLRKLVEDLLSISRIEAQGTLPQKKAHKFFAICREVFQAFSLPLSERRITVTIRDDDCLVPVDESFVALAVRNLLENAIKFTPDGGEIILVGGIFDKTQIMEWSEEIEPFYPVMTTVLHDSPNYYRFDMIDNGVGIPHEERVRVFDKFYGVGDIAYHSSGNSEFMSKGSGLGLSIVRGIMDAHRGLVWIKDGASGRGSTFSLLFPME